MPRPTDYLNSSAVGEVTVIGVDPVGSILAKPDNMNDYKRLEAYQVRAAEGGGRRPEF